MRLRLVHQISLLLLGTVFLAVLAMGALVAWNLRAGFSAYLSTQDAQLLDRVMVVAENDLRRLGGLPPGDLRARLRSWVEATAPRPQRLAEGEGAPEDLLLPPPRPGGAAPRPPRDPASLGHRLALLSPDGRELWAGRRELWQLSGQQRAIKLDGQVLALLRLSERGSAAVDQVDASFLRRQYLGIAGVAAALLLLALLAGRQLARRWVRPLQQAQAAARRIANGALEVRVAAEGDDELGELSRDLNAMAASLQRLEASRRRWIAELSHELRTPLAVLRGELEALADGIRPLDQRALASLQDEVRRLTRLTEDFHTLACSDLRELPCRFAPLQPQALLAEAVARVSERARARGLTLVSAWPQQLGSVVWDGQRIAQLLANLLENSLRYTDAPGRISLSAELQPGWLRLVVEDSPPGVPPEALPQLFDPLYRVEGSRSRESGGSGLGLAIAQALVRSHHGRILADASALGGLALTVWLPLDASQQASQAARGRA
ncbi:ATP-binding protein [Paucibacter soli]|uniref:ATP-binding protein n=1 Tax=Paucibacter soli TaxID=3133433 RepID=UPI0030B27CED